MRKDGRIMIHGGIFTCQLSTMHRRLRRCHLSSRGDGKTYYQLQCTWQSETSADRIEWSVHHRFREFALLHVALKRKISSRIARVPSFPPKHVLRRLFGCTMRQKPDERERELKDYFDKLLEMCAHLPNSLPVAELDDFLELSSEVKQYCRLAFSSSSSDSSRNIWNDPVITANRLPFDHIEFKDQLSKGMFAEVYSGYYRGQHVAIKALTLSACNAIGVSLVFFMSEIKIMAQIKHPRIVQSIGVAWNMKTDLCAVFEFMEGGDLHSLLALYRASGRPQGFDVEKLRIAKQAAEGLAYLHSQVPTVVHGGLSSHNILLTAELDAKITSFGKNRSELQFSPPKDYDKILWIAPELLLGDNDSEKSDIFALGAVLAELDTLEAPYAQAKKAYSGQSATMQTLINIAKGTIKVATSGHSSPEMNALIESCVDRDPTKRPAAIDVMHYLTKMLLLKRNENYRDLNTDGAS